MKYGKQIKINNLLSIKMKYILLLIIIISQSFAGFKVGLDFFSRFESTYEDTELDNGIVFSYDHMFNQKWGIGSDYLFPTAIDYQDIEIGILSLYMIRQLFNDKTISLTGKIGYSLPDFEWEGISDINVGLMYGFHFSFFNEIQLSYSIHNSKINKSFQNSTEQMNIKCNRLALFYLF